MSRKVSGTVIYLKTEDHHVKTYTTGGVADTLIRFADVLAELGDHGIQVHRSYWVARAHVSAVVRDGNRTMLRLINDHQVPVSRTYLPAVRSAFPNLSTRRRRAPPSPDVEPAGGPASTEVTTGT